MTIRPSVAERAALLADARACLPHLHQLVGGYFGQDWTAEHDSWMDALDEFDRESSAATRSATAGDLRRLQTFGLDEATLGRVLEDLDCDLDPRGVGLDAETWLAELLRRLDG